MARLPECTISFTYGEKWALLELFPVFVSVLLLIGVAVSTTFELWRTKRACYTIVAKMGDVLVGGAFSVCARSVMYNCTLGITTFRAGIFTLLYYTYFIVVKRALEVFACTQEEGGFYRYGCGCASWNLVGLAMNARAISMLAQLMVLLRGHFAQFECRSIDSVLGGWEHTNNTRPMGKACVNFDSNDRFTPYSQAVSALVGYGAGVPCLIGIVMVKYRARIQRDQKLWLTGFGETADDNPDYSVRRRFAKLYQVRSRTRNRASSTRGCAFFCHCHRTTYRNASHGGSCSYFVSYASSASRS